MWKQAGSAIIGAGASLIGNLFGSSSQSSANKTNMKIAQMNNEFNERMMQKQMDYNTEMWNKENEYNTAANQRKRLEDAGLNPYLMMNGGSAGVASSAGGVTPAQGNPAQVNPYNYDFSGVGHAAQTMAQQMMQKDKNDAEIRLLDMQSDWYGAQAAANIGKIIAETDSHVAKTYWQKVQNKYADGFASSAYRNQLLKNQEIETNISNMVKQGLMLSKELSIFDERFRVSVANQVADTQLKYAQGRLAFNQAATEVYKKLEVNAKIQGLKINNYVLKRSADSLVQKAKNEAIYKVDNAWNALDRVGRYLDDKLPKIF